MIDTATRSIALRDGRQLAYIELGSAGGTPILHCHGTPSSRVEGRLVYGSAAEEMGLRVLIPDRPGMGGSDWLPGRRITDWPADVADLADALGLDRFAVLGSSGGSPYALASGVALPDRVAAVGVLGGIAPLDAPGMAAAISGPLRVMTRLSSALPPLARALFRLNLKAMRSGGSSERMGRMFPEPDRKLLEQAEIRDGFMACFAESCRHGTRGPVLDTALLARPWGFDFTRVTAPVRLWHGEQDRNVPVAHGRFLERSIAGCLATYFPGEAHLSTFVNRRHEILAALVAAAQTRA